MKGSSLFNSMLFMENEKNQDYEDKINELRGKLDEMQNSYTK